VRDEHQRLLEESMRLQKALQREPRGRHTLDNVIGDSRPMQQVFVEVHQAAPSRATVLLRGESGTGKEAIARAIHFLSPRKDGPFIKVNCAALTESLLESELFGHEKGAFTGAIGERKGRFELAHGGTLFLDEIGDVSPAFQAKLLRVLQEREFERVGGSKAGEGGRAPDLRHQPRPREDGAARRVPRRPVLPHQRGGHLPAAAARAPRRHPAAGGAFPRPLQQGKPSQLKVTPEAMKVLTSCYWPGNVRELENCIERTATMVQGDHPRPGLPLPAEPLPDADAALPRQGRCGGRGGESLHAMPARPAPATADDEADEVTHPRSRASARAAPAAQPGAARAASRPTASATA
jgi:Nif-specific regulatory protein